jgi:SWI/SNF-related matrix-associated actin-dependent regulator of chromatin subfamily A-like protein 1
MANQSFVLPAYLNQPIFTGHYYGELHYEKHTDSWIIKGEPIVCQMAKKLFPGSSGRHKGEARFKRNKRINGDLNWLMMRYPLKIMNPELWEQDIREAREHVQKRLEIQKKPQKLEPSSMIFNGTLKEFQKEGVSFLYHNAPTLLGDEMGLGKTVQALGWISVINDFPGIIVCPKNIVLQWKESIEQFIKPLPSLGQQSLFDEPETMVHIIKGLRPYELPEAHFYIIHYGLLRGWKNVLPEYHFKFLVFDEIQELRHSKSEKYSAASLLAESVPNRIGLSGTPIYNKGGEIWNVLNILEFHCLGDWDSFTREWCYGYGSDTVADPELLGEYLRREGLMIRRTKDEVIDELPKKRRVTHYIDYDQSVLDKHIEKALMLIQQLDESKDELEKGRLKREIVRHARQATGIAKAPYVAEFVKMIVEAGEPVVLYGWHHAVYDIWMHELRKYNPVKITGEETDKQKQENKQKFIRGETDIIIISLRAAAGLDGLQHRANVNVFGELDWSPGIHAQCEARLHRYGQKNSVLSYYLVTKDGMDDEMLDALGFKTAQFVGIMGDKMETEEERLISQIDIGKHINSIIDKLKGKLEKKLSM